MSVISFPEMERRRRAIADLDNILIFVNAAHAWEQGTSPVDSAIECRDTDPLGGHLRVAALTTRALRTDEPGRRLAPLLHRLRRPFDQCSDFLGM